MVSVTTCLYCPSGGFSAEFSNSNKGYIPNLMDLPAGLAPPPPPPAVAPDAMGQLPVDQPPIPGMEPPTLPGPGANFGPHGLPSPGINSAISQAVLHAAMLRMQIPGPTPMPQLGVPNVGFPTPPIRNVYSTLWLWNGPGDFLAWGPRTLHRHIQV